MNDHPAQLTAESTAAREAKGITVRRRFATGPRAWDVPLAIAVGGALGAVARYAVSTAWPHAPNGIPWATFAVNVAGCFLIGVLMVLLTEIAGQPHHLIRPFLGVGILGGFTTFSTYTVDVQHLLANGHPQLALLYLFGTLGAALVAVQFGIFAARLLAQPRRGRRP
ncbi:MAG TPA: fluoride efflux transporter CrcB [Candidatus Dormibacteraeota bacterium]